jgi:hypothetical protein
MYLYMRTNFYSTHTWLLELFIWQIFTLRITVTIRIYNTLEGFFLNNQQDALIIQVYSVIKLYMFRASSQPIFRSQQSQDGTELHPDSAWKRSSKTCMKLTNAECTVENS